MALSIIGLSQENRMALYTTGASDVRQNGGIKKMGKQQVIETLKETIEFIENGKWTLPDSVKVLLGELKCLIEDQELKESLSGQTGGASREPIRSKEERMIKATPRADSTQLALWAIKEAAWHLYGEVWRKPVVGKLVGELTHKIEGDVNSTMKKLGYDPSFIVK